MNDYDAFFRLHSKTHGLYAKNTELEKECLSLQTQISTFEQELVAIAVSFLS